MDLSLWEARLLFRSNTIQRLVRPHYEDLCPIAEPGAVGTSLTPQATRYRQRVMRYDYMRHVGRDFDAPSEAWNRLLGQKPAIRPFRLRIQRGTGKLPKLLPVYGVAPMVKIPAVVTRLQELTTKEYPTLQPHYFDSFVRGNNPREDVVGWLDILNGFCWFTDAEMFLGVLRMLGLSTLWSNSIDKLPWETTYVFSSGKQNVDVSSATPALIA